MIAYKQMPPPAMVDNEIGCIAFAAVTRRNFYADAIDGRNEGEDVEQYSVFLELRIFPETYIF